MKTILVLLALFSFSAVAGEMKILKDSSGYSIIKEEAKDTGLVMQEGLVLTQEQLAHVIETKEPLPLNVEKKNQRWDKYALHIKYENVSTEQAMLEGKVIKKVPKTVTVEKESFSPFFILAVVYIVCMILGYIITDFFWFVAIFVGIGATVAIATSALDSALALFVPVALVIVITLVAALVASASAVTNKRKLVPFGIGLMVISAGIMYFGI